MESPSGLFTLVHNQQSQSQSQSTINYTFHYPSKLLYLFSEAFTLSVIDIMYLFNVNILNFSLKIQNKYLDEFRHDVTWSYIGAVCCIRPLVSYYFDTGIYEAMAPCRLLDQK